MKTPARAGAAVQLIDAGPPPEDSGLKASLKGALRILPAVLAPAFANLAALVGLARLLTPHEFGQFSLVQAISTFVLLGTGSWVASTAIQFLSTRHTAEQDAYAAMRHFLRIFVVTGVAIGALACAVLPSEWRAVVWMGVVLAVPASLFLLPWQALRARGRDRAYNGYAIARYLIPTAAGIVAAAFLRTTVSFVAASSICVFFLLPTVTAAVRRGLSASTTAAGESFNGRIRSYALPLIPAFMLTNILALSDRLVVGAYLGASAAGKYTAAYSFGSLPVQFLTAALTLSIGPATVRWWHHDRDNALSLIGSALYSAVALTAPVVVFVVAISPYALPKLFGPVGEHVGREIVPLVAVGEAFVLAQWYVQRPLMLAEKTRLVLIGTAAAAALNLGMNIVLVPMYGIAAAAFSTLIADIALFVAMLLLSNKVGRVRLRRGLALICAVVALLSVILAVA